MKNKLKSFIYRLLTHTVGNALVALQPKKALELSKKGMTLEMCNHLSAKERLMRNAMLKKLEKKKDYKTLENYHKNYWANYGAEFFSKTNDSFKTEFLTDCAFIFDELHEQLLKQTETFTTLVEIGTGNGNVLNYLNSKFPKIEKFIGIDLSEKQINLNTEKYKENEKIEFVTSDGFEWVNENGHSNMIFVTSRGVLEYFTEDRLTEFLAKLNSLGKTIFVAIEPNGIHHNFDENPNSELYGHERSFSHNYAELFKNAGFSLWHLSFKPYDETALLSYIGAEN